MSFNRYPNPIVGPGTGDVVGPASSVDNALVRFDGTTGKSLQGSAVIVSDTGTVTTPGSLKAGGSFAAALVSKTGTYAVLATDFVVLNDATAAAYSVTLPTAASIAGRLYTLKKTDVSANAVTVHTTGGQLIDGASTYALALQYKYVTVVSDGANWNIIANN